MTRASTPSSPPPLRLKIASDPANLASARRAVEAFAEALGFDATSVGEIGLSVNEAVANVMRHAYDGATDRLIEIHADAEFDSGSVRAIRVSIRDWGNGVNPAVRPVTSHDPLTPGGLGMICLKTMMDDMRYSPQNDGGMLLTMTRLKSHVSATEKKSN